jgi:hypothetical protein
MSSIKPLRYLVVTYSISKCFALQDQISLQPRSVGQSSIRNDSESRQRVQPIQPCPCRHLQHEEHVVNTQEHVCHLGTTMDISDGSSDWEGILTPFVSSVSPLATFGTAHHR